MTTNSEPVDHPGESADSIGSGKTGRRDAIPEDANPFSTSRVQPGAISYLFAPGESLAGLIERLSRQCQRGQIVGPHGVGKSTLLVALARELAAAGDFVELRRIGPSRETWRRTEFGDSPASTASDGESPAMDARVGVSAGDVSTIEERERRRWLLVDGWEQLSAWRRWWIDWSCRWRGEGLVATCHADGGLPELVRLEVDPARLRQLVVTLLEGFPAWVSEADVMTLWERSPNNVREILFGLYDLYEVRRRSKRPRDGS